jgi:hypothetical protein
LAPVRRAKRAQSPYSPTTRQRSPESTAPLSQIDHDAKGKQTMNHIARLISERDEAQQTLRDAFYMLTELEHYLTSAKFNGPDNDYVHVRTDILPKIAQVRFKLIEG